MLKLGKIAVVSLAASMIASVASVAHAKDCPAISTAQVEALFGNFNAAWATKDPAKVTALFSSHPVLLATVQNAPATTPDAVKAYFVSFLKNSPVAHIDTSSIAIDCDMASRLGTWTVTLTNPTSGAKTDVKARYSFIYRYENGAWKIYHLHSSMMPEK